MVVDGGAGDHLGTARRSTGRFCLQMRSARDRGERRLARAAAAVLDRPSRPWWSGWGARRGQIAAVLGP